MYDVEGVLKWGDKMCGNRNLKKKSEFYCVHIDTVPEYAVADLHNFKY